jgi:hypothetical protein
MEIEKRATSDGSEASKSIPDPYLFADLPYHEVLVKLFSNSKRPLSKKNRESLLIVRYARANPASLEATDPSIRFFQIRSLRGGVDRMQRWCMEAMSLIGSVIGSRSFIKPASVS